MYLSEELELQHYLHDEQTSSNNMLRLVGIGDRVEIRAIDIGGDYEVCVLVPAEEFPYQKQFYFTNFDSSRDYIMRLFPEIDWETTGW